MTWQRWEKRKGRVSALPFHFLRDGNVQFLKIMVEILVIINHWFLFRLIYFIIVQISNAIINIGIIHKPVAINDEPNKLVGDVL